MKRRILSLLTLLLLFQLVANAQITKANRLFHRFDYANAIPYYQKEIDNNKKNKNEAMQRMADCYRLTGNFSEAAAWYAKVVLIPGVDPVNFYYYGQALRSIDNPKLAQEQFRKFASLKPGDSRGEKFAAFIDQADKWKALPKQYTVTNAGKLNSVNSEFSPVFFKEGIMYASDRVTNEGSDKIYGWTGASYLNLFYADAHLQADTNYLFSDPKLYSSEINEPFHDGPACFNKAGNLIFFTRAVKNRGEIDSSRFYTNRLKLFSAQFDGKKWSDIVAFPYNSDNYSVGHPALSGDGNTLYFVSDMPGGNGGTDLYISKRENGTWSKPLNLGTTVNSPGNEVFPVLNNDSILYFSSDGLAGMGGLDIFKTTITSTGYSKPEDFREPINSPADDFGVLFNADETAGMLSSNRTGGIGKDDIYTIRKVSDSLLFAGFVKDKSTLLPLAGATVFAWDYQSQKVKILKTDASGHYALKVKSGDSLTVKSMLPGFAPDILSLTIKCESGHAKKMGAPRDLLLSQYKVDQVFKLDNIYFNFDKWNIREDAAMELNKLVTFLTENPPVEVELSSFTDCRGSDSYNEKLSQRRAESTVNYIVEHNIAKSRITAKGYGESRPVNKCTDGNTCTPEEYQANRRTEFKITGIQEKAKPAEIPLGKYMEGQTLDIKSFGNSFFELIKPAVSMKQPDQGKTMYKVQLLATRAPIRTTDYFTKILSENPGLKIEEIVEADGLYHYNAGSFDERAQAKKFLKAIKHDGYIFTYKAGKIS